MTQSLIEWRIVEATNMIYHWTMMDFTTNNYVDWNTSILAPIKIICLSPNCNIIKRRYHHFRLCSLTSSLIFWYSFSIHMFIYTSMIWFRYTICARHQIAEQNQKKGISFAREAKKANRPKSDRIESHQIHKIFVFLAWTVFLSDSYSDKLTNVAQWLEHVTKQHINDTVVSFLTVYYTILIVIFVVFVVVGWRGAEYAKLLRTSLCTMTWQPSNIISVPFQVRYRYLFVYADVFRVKTSLKMVEKNRMNKNENVVLWREKWLENEKKVDQWRKWQQCKRNKYIF